MEELRVIFNPERIVFYDNKTLLFSMNKQEALKFSKKINDFYKKEEELHGN